MKTRRENWGVASFFTSVLGVQHHDRANLPRERTPLPTNRSVGGPQSRSGQVWKKKKNILAPTGIRTSDRPARSLVTMPTASSLSPEKLWTDLNIISTFLMSFEECGRKHLCPFMTPLFAVLGTFLILGKFRKILDNSVQGSMARWKKVYLCEVQCISCVLIRFACDLVTATLSYP